MDRTFSVGDGLELLVLSDLSKMSPELLQKARIAAEQGEELQRQVFNERNVSFPDERVLLAVDSIGGPDIEPQLDGTSPDYNLLYLVKDGRVIGMRATEKLDVPDLGAVVLDYLPPLVLQKDANTSYLIKTGGRSGFIGLSKELTPVQILWNFAGHLAKPMGVVAHFTDGIGVSKEQLQENGYLRSEAAIWAPPQSAGSYDLADAAARAKARKEHMTVLPEPVHMFAKFASNVEPQIPREAAEWLFVTKYLKDGYIDTGHLRKIELRDKKQIIAEQGSITEEQHSAIRLRLNELPCVVRTRESIMEAAGKRGYVAFWPIS